LSAVERMILHDCRQLVSLFNDIFVSGEFTCLESGGEEPVYLPAENGEPHRIVFTRDYFASALHEIAHWCVAGPGRRQLPDYGYWYAPDGRTAEQQAEFERLEVRPQALEWLFSVAAGYRFRVSADNLVQGLGASEAFKDAIHRQVLHHCAVGVSQRVSAFLKALIRHYGTATDLDDLLRSERFERGGL
jgi:elongation factor P hydroxylase